MKGYGTGKRIVMQGGYEGRSIRSANATARNAVPVSHVKSQIIRPLPAEWIAQGMQTAAPGGTARNRSGEKGSGTLRHERADELYAGRTGVRT